VLGFVRAVALELAELAITVNAVAPGPIDTQRFGPGLRAPGSVRWPRWVFLDEVASVGHDRRDVADLADPQRRRRVLVHAVVVEDAAGIAAVLHPRPLGDRHRASRPRDYRLGSRAPPLTPAPIICSMSEHA
jgi:NAD(P)-dependent dehydrogenase (short-subunit alcohol dehydrogenase family)